MDWVRMVGASMSMHVYPCVPSLLCPCSLSHVSGVSLCHVVCRCPEKMPVAESMPFVERCSEKMPYAESLPVHGRPEKMSFGPFLP